MPEKTAAKISRGSFNQLELGLEIIQLHSMSNCMSIEMLNAILRSNIKMYGKVTS